ncbi:MAG: aldo/keto reductase, partial [Alphaproteobacteria bacterium]|nr:aldo/keto reductase [Alphaproteobacteria bacterium]
GGATPPKARLTLFPDYKRYLTKAGIAATERYVALARRHGLDPATMALAYCHQRPFLTSTIVGATSMEQLKANIASIDVKLPDSVLAEIDAVHAEISNPCP